MYMHHTQGGLTTLLPKDIHVYYSYRVIHNVDSGDADGVSVCGQ